MIARPSSDTGSQSKGQDSRDLVDWAMKGGGGKYGSIDTTRTASAGHGGDVGGVPRCEGEIDDVV